MEKLLLGITYQNHVHYHFDVLPLTLAGECQAMEVIENLGLHDIETLSYQQQRLVELAYLAQQMTIEGIPRDVLTPEFLFNALTTDDYVLINEKIAEMRKKRIDAGANQASNSDD